MYHAFKIKMLTILIAIQSTQTQNPDGKRPSIIILEQRILYSWFRASYLYINPYPTAFPYGNGMVLHFYQQQESSTTKTVHKVINKGLKTYV